MRTVYQQVLHLEEVTTMMTMTGILVQDSVTMMMMILILILDRERDVEAQVLRDVREERLEESQNLEKRRDDQNLEKLRDVRPAHKDAHVLHLQERREL